MVASEIQPCREIYYHNLICKPLGQASSWELMLFNAEQFMSRLACLGITVVAILISP